MVSYNANISPDQILLLKAALLPAPEALEYWQKWKIGQGLTDSEIIQDKKILERIFDPLDRGSYRLMPLVYRNLEATNDPIVKRMRGIYRHSWMRNQQQLHWYGKVVGVLHAAGIETMCIKGLAMSLLYYDDLGGRYMNDIDVLVPYEERQHAMQALLTSSLGLWMEPFDYHMQPYYHGTHFHSENGFNLDLHHHLMGYNLAKDLDAIFWQSSNPIKVKHDLPGSTLSPTHQIFHNIAHGNAPHIEESPLRWIADCYVIYTNHTIDWTEILQLAVKFRLVWPVQDGMRLLIKEFGLILPKAVRQTLEALVPSAEEVAFRHFLYSTLYDRGTPRKYYLRSRYEHNLYFKQYTGQAFWPWFGRKSLARGRAMLATAPIRQL